MEVEVSLVTPARYDMKKGRKAAQNDVLSYTHSGFRQKDRNRQRQKTIVDIPRKQHPDPRAQKIDDWAKSSSLNTPTTATA